MSKKPHQHLMLPERLLFVAVLHVLANIQARVAAMNGSAGWSAGRNGEGARATFRLPVHFDPARHGSAPPSFSQPLPPSAFQPT